MKTLIHTLIGLAAATGAAVAAAQAGKVDHDSHHPAASAAAAAAPSTEGEVRKIDTGAGKLTLRHGPIVNLDMPAMTMVFRVADSKLLASLKEGDKVRFRAEKVNGAYTVTAIEPAAP